MKTLTKEEIVAVLEEIADILELKNENKFKVIAFQNAARILEGNPQEPSELAASGELEKLKGIGKGHIASIIRELLATGKSKDHAALRKGLPDGLFELLKVPGLGPKRVKFLYDKCKIKSIADLEKACKGKTLGAYEGFGEKLQEKILASLQRFKKNKGRFLYEHAMHEAQRVLDALKKIKGVKRAEIAGSLRRAKEIVHDIDILVATDTPKPVHAAFVKSENTAHVLAQGDTKSSVVLRSGIQCDLRTVTEKEYPAALYYFTGSKEHNVAVRTLAKKKNIKVNEYGLFRGSRSLPCKDEAELFEALGLHYIPPEARENFGEIEWAAKKPFPKLVEEKDIRGTFHVHSTYSDGTGTLEDMIRAAQDQGYEYVGISDHSQTAKYAGGLDETRLEKQWREIDRLQKKFKIRIFKGIESDILMNGDLDYPEKTLKKFDFIIGSVHSRFNLPEKEMTDRICRAMQNPHMTFLGHLSGRLLLSRDSYPIDMKRIFDTASKTGVVIEINGQPERLELDWRLCHEAKRRGLKLSIHPDAHSVNGFICVRYALNIARKGWLEKKDILNTMPLAEMEKYLAKRKS